MHSKESLQRHILKIDIDGQELHLETGKVAKHANGAVIVRLGDTMVFSAACAKPEADTETDFFPLRVDYQEKLSSTGKTAGGFIKREGKPSEKEILVSRLIDRPIRPMFPDGYFNEVQLLSYVWSYDGVHMPQPLAICAASAALVISDIPLMKPIGAVRVGRVGEQFIINPTAQQMKESSLDLVLAGTEDAILMIEGYCDFLTEDEVLMAIEKGQAAIAKICHKLAEWQQHIGKAKAMHTIQALCPDLLSAVEAYCQTELQEALKIRHKTEREEALSATHRGLVQHITGQQGAMTYSETVIARAFKSLKARYMRQMIIHDQVRCDGRKFNEVRFIDVEQSFLPRTHGSSLFTRGETQALAVCTLGPETMAQRSESLDGEDLQRFYLQYFFPPFSVGEVGRMGPAGRREVGHGKLAERALQAIMPETVAFPYTIRLESNITESNGSSSMASVCGGCLALMDAGVPIKRPISGIAMGLILEENHCVILSDILGVEDSLGDMDFKVTGDQYGITAFQMDIKIEGITFEIMRKALIQAKEGRVHILQKMLEVCPTSNSQLAAHAPRIETLQIKPSKIGSVIGPSGKQIRAIIEATGAQVDINDTGVVNIMSNNAQGLEKAKEMILGIVREPEVGMIYEGRVTSIMPFGAFVEIYAGKEGLCHISELDFKRIEQVSDVVKEGQIISVKLLEINDRGQLKLSRRATLPKPVASAGS